GLGKESRDVHKHRKSSPGAHEKQAHHGKNEFLALLFGRSFGGGSRGGRSGHGANSGWGDSISFDQIGRNLLAFDGIGTRGQNSLIDTLERAISGQKSLLHFPRRRGRRPLSIRRLDAGSGTSFGRGVRIRSGRNNSRNREPEESQNTLVAN